MSVAPSSAEKGTTGGGESGSGKRRGRPKGSKTRPREVVYQFPAVCIKCGSMLNPAIADSRTRPDKVWWTREGVKLVGERVRIQRCSNESCLQVHEVHVYPWDAEDSQANDE